jgi:hypothetical protein
VRAVRRPDAVGVQKDGVRNNTLLT